MDRVWNLFMGLMVVAYGKEQGCGGTDFYIISTLDVGDGCHIRFWHDRLCRDHLLKVVFPILYECSIATEASVYSCLLDRLMGK